MTAYCDAFHQYLYRYFYGHPSAIKGPVRGTPWNLVDDEEFHVIEFAPGLRSDRWTYVSVGSGTVQPNGGRRIEFILCSREPSERHVEIVEMTAFYHVNGHTLDVGHTLPIGQPWLPGGTLDHLLVARPYPFEPMLDRFRSGRHQAQLLWLVPITRSESELRHEKGLDALESRLESSGIDYTDPSRMDVSMLRRWWTPWRSGGHPAIGATPPPTAATSERRAGTRRSGDVHGAHTTE